MKTPRVPRVPRTRGEYQRPGDDSLVERAGRKSHRAGTPAPQDAKPVRSNRKPKSGRRKPSHPHGWEYDRNMKADRPRVAIDSDPELFAPQGRHHRRGRAYEGRHRPEYEGRHRKG